MSDFADIERFVRAHAACGGITPNATTPQGGGYLLTLTCVCGVAMERWITAEEAKQPLPLARSAPAPAPPPPPAPAAPRAPSSDLEEVMRLALEAEDATAPPPPPPPVRPAAPRVSLDEALRRAVDADAAATPPPPRPAAPSPRTASPPPVAVKGRSAPARLAANDAVDAAMKQVQTQTSAAAVPAASGSRLWFGVVIVVLVLGGAGLWLALQKLNEEAELGSTAGVPAAAPVVASAAERAALGEVLKPLRDLQADSSQTVAYPVYSSHVAAAKADVDRYLGTAAPPELKAGVRDALELHVLASAAWRARTLDSKEVWEAVGDDPAVDLCPSARRAAEAAPAPGAGSPAHARGVGIASAIPLLWECAATRLADLDRAAAAN